LRNLKVVVREKCLSIKAGYARVTCPWCGGEIKVAREAAQICECGALHRMRAGEVFHIPATQKV